MLRTQRIKLYINIHSLYVCTSFPLSIQLSLFIGLVIYVLFGLPETKQDKKKQQNEKHQWPFESKSLWEMSKKKRSPDTNLTRLYQQAFTWTNDFKDASRSNRVLVSPYS